MLDVIKTTIFSLLRYPSPSSEQPLCPNDNVLGTQNHKLSENIYTNHMIIILYYCLIRSFYWLFWMITVILTCSFTRLLTDRGFLDKDIIKATEAFEVLEEAIEVIKDIKAIIGSSGNDRHVLLTFYEWWIWYETFFLHATTYAQLAPSPTNLVRQGSPRLSSTLQMLPCIIL